MRCMYQRTSRERAAKGALRTVIVHGCRLHWLAWGCVVPLLGAGLCGPRAWAEPPADSSRREAAGWLQLERDQRSYRERVEPLDLREQRVLETIERRQRNDLRDLQQRQRRELETRQSELRRSRQQASPDSIPEPRRPGLGFEQQRQLDRQRLDRRMEQERLPFGRSRDYR